MESDETMANDDQFDDGFEDNRGFDDAPPAKKGMSTGVKILIGLLAGGGVFALICCGGLFYLGQKVIDSAVETPEEVRQVSESIVHMEVPERFTPKLGIKFELFGVGMAMARYIDEDSKSVITLMQTSQPGGDAPEHEMERIEESLDQQGLGDQFRKAEIENAEVEPRNLTIRGKEVEFKFVKGQNAETGEELRQIMGTFPGNGGAAILLIQIPAESYNEDEIVQMIESIE